MGLERPDAGIVLAAQEDAMAIGVEMTSLDMEIVERGVHHGRALAGRFVASQELDLADDSVPVGLGILGIGVAVAVDLLGHSA